MAEPIEVAGFTKRDEFYEVKTVAGGSITLEPTLQQRIFELAVYDANEWLILKQKLHVVVVGVCGDHSDA